MPSKLSYFGKRIGMEKLLLEIAPYFGEIGEKFNLSTRMCNRQKYVNTRFRVDRF